MRTRVWSNHRRFTVNVQRVLAGSGTQQALFISDPTNGDIFVIGEGADKFPIPSTATGHQLTTADDLLNLDFEVYEGNDPPIFLTAQDGGFVRLG